ncbi:AsmA family protein, partial [Dyella sp.]|uniref:AsmA family protein n=1 Tax=Dyella sp. TaxID=1869338 RepID=UPI002ED5BA91
MRRGRKILVWIVGILVLLIAIIVIIIATFDWNRAKPFINDKVSQAIGRRFEIQGDLSVHWQREPDQGWLASIVPWPEFVAQQIRVANPDWAKNQQFATLDALRFRISPLALLAHRIAIPTVQLVKPDIDLERDKQSRANWEFALPQSSGPSTWTLDLGAIGFDRGHIALDDASTRIQMQVNIEPLQKAIPYDEIVAQQSERARDQAQKTTGGDARKALANDKDDEPKTRPASAYAFSWQAKGTYQGTSLYGDGKTGGVLALQQSDQPFPVQADMHIGDSHIALVGTLTDPMHLAALDLRLWFSGTSMAKLYPITGLTLPDTPPYATEGHLTAQLHKNNSHFSYHNFRGRVGGSDLGGDLDFTTAGP